MKRFEIRRVLGGGGNREEVRDVVRETDLAAKKLRSETALRSVYPSKSSLIEGLMLQEVAHDNNFNLTETVYSQLTTHHSLKKAAFTLAEVLITLGIIGVVAAIT